MAKPQGVLHILQVINFFTFVLRSPFSEDSRCARHSSRRRDSVTWQFLEERT